MDREGHSLRFYPLRPGRGVFCEPNLGEHPLDKGFTIIRINPILLYAALL
jgi:hypothetical protein